MSRRADRRLHAVTGPAGAAGIALAEASEATEAPSAQKPLLRVVVGARLRRARAAQGRSLREVAEEAGVSTGHLSQVERGLAEASSEVLRAVCRSLSLPQAVLLRAVSADLALAELEPAAAPSPLAAPAVVQALAA